MGDQIRGFGFLHDGSVDTINRFLSAGAFSRTAPPPAGGNPGGFDQSAAGNKLRRQAEQFILAFETNLKPVVGQQVTVTHSNQVAAAPRITLLMARAEVGDCELVAKGAGRGYLYVGHGGFKPDRMAARQVTSAALLSSSDAVTFTCAPIGSGVRLGIDRDQDGRLDGDE
jgi:hypothetical protein